MTGSHFGIVPRRVARLRLPRRALNVLIAIASRANRDRITPPLSRDDIASEVGIDRSKVGLCVRKLKENGVLELVVEGGGRGRANVYRIIPDEEASAPLPCPRGHGLVFGPGWWCKKCKRSVYATDCDDEANVDDDEPPLINGAAAGPETAAENGAVSGSKTGPFPARNGAAAGPPTESTEITEPPLRGGRAREEGVSNRSGSTGRKPPSSLSLSDFQPGAKFVTWARENTPLVDPLDQAVISQFRDWHLSRGTELKDLEAAYRKWLRDESRFSSRNQCTRQHASERKKRGSMIDTALDEVRKVEAING